MLIQSDIIQQIKNSVKSLVSGISVRLLGRDVLSNTPDVAVVVTGQDQILLSVLEKAFLAGKIAGETSPELLRKMSEKEMGVWLKENQLSLSDQDFASLETQRAHTTRWLRSLNDKWGNQIETEIIRGDVDWEATLRAGPGSIETLSREKKAAVTRLLGDLDTRGPNVLSDVDTLVQTQFANYFQQGQASRMNPDTRVYKTPRKKACQHCMRLHLNSNGSQKVYRLGDVQGNSNIGRKAASWVFTIGPVHPHCFAAGTEVVVDQPPGKIAIEQIEPGVHKVLTRVGWRDVVKVFANGPAWVNQYALSNRGTFWATPDHRVLTSHQLDFPQLLEETETVSAVETGFRRKARFISLNRVSKVNSSLFVWVVADLMDADSLPYRDFEPTIAFSVVRNMQGTRSAQVYDLQVDDPIFKEYTLAAGPIVHNCYCVLYDAAKRPPRPSAARASARRSRLAPVQKSATVWQDFIEPDEHRDEFPTGYRALIDRL